MWEGVRGRSNEKLRGEELWEANKKRNQAKERDSAGHEPEDEGGSSHYKAMRRLVGGEEAMEPDFESMRSEVEAME